MEFENMVVFAAATGRTLILPPDHTMYLLHRDKDARHRGMQDFFHGFQEAVEFVTTAEFIEREAIRNETYPLPTDESKRMRILAAMERCNVRAKAENSCFAIYDYLSDVADHVPKLHGESHCLVFHEPYFRRALKLRRTKNATDSGAGTVLAMDEETYRRARRFCGDRRLQRYYDTDMHDADLIHFRTGHKETRILAHFYAFLFFADPVASNHYKRLVRDRVRYADAIFCAGGKIVRELVADGRGRGFDTSVGFEGRMYGGYSAVHIRRGDFQWKKMRLSAEEWYENTKDCFLPGEVLYVATDELNRTFFDPLAEHYELRFLDDYHERAGIDDLDPNFAGMIEQVVLSRSRIFVGTYFSSFSAYVGRMRGYHGMSGRDMYYGQVDYKNITHRWEYPHASYSAREYPIGWINIDGNDEPTAEDYF